MPRTGEVQGYAPGFVMLHWGMAGLAYGLYALGLWMTGLDYAHPWYYRAPQWHQALGVLLAALWLVRIAWRSLEPVPAPVGRPLEQWAARWMHRLLYALIAACVASGYLTATADGRGLSVLGLLEIPAPPFAFERQEDVAGAGHEAFAHALVVFSLLHALAALKHHFIDRDDTLRRMLRSGVSRHATIDKEEG